MTKIKFHVILMLGMMLLSFSACEGIFDGVYDDPQQASASTNGFGFIEVNDGTHSGTVYVHTEDYERWVYINLYAHSVDSTHIENEEGLEVPFDENGALPDEWDFAIHRYDTKTNGGAVLETSMESMDEVRKLTAIPEGNYVEDTPQTTDKITIDMSGMMDGVLKYAKSDYNPELSKWLNVDKSQMPPIYTLSNKVYVIRLKDGSHAAIRLVDFKNAENIKGYMKIEYIYPLEGEINQG